MPGNRCSNCISYSFECTYVEAAKVCLTSPLLLWFYLDVLLRNVAHQKGEILFRFIILRSTQRNLKAMSKALKIVWTSWKRFCGRCVTPYVYSNSLAQRSFSYAQMNQYTESSAPYSINGTQNNQFQTP